MGREKQRGVEEAEGDGADPQPLAKVQRGPRPGWLGSEQLVAIIGGGVGGLATALVLQQAGFRARVYERDTGVSARHQGYGVTLSTTNSALEALDLLQELRARDVPSRSHYTFRSDGAVLGYFGNALRADETGAAVRDGLCGGTGDRGNLRVPRQVLRQMLLDRLSPGSVIWGARLAGFEELTLPAATGDDGGGGVALTFESGERLEAVALVGADGVHSLVRRRRRPAAVEPSYLGIFISVGITACDHSLLKDRGFYTVDGRRRSSG